MPPSSTIYVYGGLGNKPVGDVSIGDLIFQDKTVTGFWLTSWLKNKQEAERVEAYQNVANLMKDSFKPVVAKEFNLDKMQEGLEFYRKNMTEGKVLIKPWIGEE